MDANRGGSWLDCGIGRLLFHKNNSELSNQRVRSANRMVGRPAPIPRNGAAHACRSGVLSTRYRPLNHVLARSNLPDSRTPCPAEQDGEISSAVATGLHCEQACPFKSGCSAIATAPRFRLRVFPWLVGIFDRRKKNAHIISTALPTAVGPSIRRALWQAGQAKRLRNARRITLSFRTRRPLRGMVRAGPRTVHSAAGPSPRLGRVPCPRPGCCSIAQVMPPLPV